MIDEPDVTHSKVLPFARAATALSKRLPQLAAFPKFAKEFGGTAAPAAPVPMARPVQDTKRLPD